DVAGLLDGAEVGRVRVFLVAVRVFARLLLGFDGREGVVACHHVVRREPRRAVRLHLAGAVPAAADSDAGLARLALAVKVYRDGPNGQRFGLLGGLDQDGAIQGGHRALLVRVGFLSRVVPRAWLPQFGHARCSYRWPLACTVFPVAVMVWPQDGHASSSSLHMPRWGMPVA